MAKIIKCPTCQVHIDVADVVPGSVMRCPDCNASLRVPGAPAASTPAAPARAEGLRSSPLFRRVAQARMAGSQTKAPSRRHRVAGSDGGGRGENPLPVMLGIGGAVLLAIVLTVFVINQNRAPKPASRAPNVVSAPPENADVPDSTPIQPPEPPKKKPESLARGTGGSGYVPPAGWERGAKTYLEPGVKPLGVDPQIAQEVEPLLRRREFKALVDKADRYLNAVINCMVEDDEALGRGAFETLHLLCEVKGMHLEESKKNPVDLGFVNSALYRGREFGFWTDWWQRNKQNLGPAVVEYAPVEAGAVDWARLIQDLRPGGGYENEASPEGKALAMVKRMGRTGLLKLIEYSDHEDVMLARGVCAALNHLSGQQVPLPTEANKAQIKRQWQDWATKN